jgi:spermidine synthase
MPASTPRTPYECRCCGCAEAKRRFDLIVADRPDPVGSGKALFGDNFYQRVRQRAPARRLCPKMPKCTQPRSPFLGQASHSQGQAEALS